MLFGKTVEKKGLGKAIGTVSLIKARLEGEGFVEKVRGKWCVEKGNE